ncbi:hypothetical protein ACIP5Y_07600 [Nocardia sp. NPDC088792]|uniref:hypothetical protein n=1 Tax=Nocardia sp. NPDC088792 TaxID=3364332 RepID=UPI0038094C1D
MDPKKTGVVVRGQRFQFGSAEWPAGKGVLQVYAPVALERNPALAELIPKFRDAMTGAPVVAVPDRYLHVTIDVVADVPLERIPDSELRELAAAIGENLTDVPPFRGTAGPAIAGGTGAKLYISPASPLMLAQRQVRTAIRAVRGEPAATWIQPRPHVTTHFCTLPPGETIDSDPWNRNLYKAVDSLLAPIEITHVLLVEVRADDTTREFSWSPVSDPIPLAG